VGLRWANNLKQDLKLMIQIKFTQSTQGGGAALNHFYAFETLAAFFFRQKSCAGFEAQQVRGPCVAQALGK
jgi:hypothetical protein